MSYMKVGDLLIRSEVDFRPAFRIESTGYTFYVFDSNDEAITSQTFKIDFVKEFFPQYITDKVIEYYDIQQENFSDENTEQQEEIYKDIQKEFFENEKIKINTE